MITRNLRFQLNLVVVCCFFTLNTIAQNTVTGIVKDAITNEPLIGASVFVKGTTSGALTDIDGSYSVTTSKDATILQISYTGYRTQEVDIKGKVDPAVNVAMMPGLELDIVVVSASRKAEPIKTTPAAVSVIESKNIEADLTANPFSLMRNTPGVDIAQYGVSDGHINLRGRAVVFTTETFIISDYRNLLIPSFGAIQYGQQPIDAIDLDRIEIVKGPSGALYGPGVESGIVHFISKSPFKTPGTTISIGGGNQSQLQASFRHAGILNDGKLGYKITGFYRSATDFEVDTTEAAAAARLANYPATVVSAVDGDFVADGTLDYDILNYGITGMVEYRFSPEASLIGTVGYGKSEGLFRTGQGEGYTKAGRPFAQIRYQSKNLSAQAFWSKQLGNDGNSWIYASGLTAINEIDQYEGQIQYKFDLAKNKLNIITGVDYRTNIIDTKESVNGRFEEEDDYSIYGFYLQAKYNIIPELDIIGATRVDQFTALDQTSFSPRVALVYQPATDQSVRLTWNRAVGAPLSLNLYSDLTASDRGAFKVHLHGGAQPLTYNQQEVYSFVTQSMLPDLNFPLRVAYGAATEGLAASGQLPAALISYLSNQTAAITGNTLGATTATPLSRDKLKASETNMYELGYRGFLNDKFGITIDAYYIQRKNNLTGTTVASPLVLYPTAGDDLATIVAASLNADSLAQFGLTPQAISGIYKAALETLTTDGNGNPSPLGLISADQSPTGQTLDATFFNIEEVDYFGLDVELKYLLNSDFTIFTNLSWLSDNFWDAAPVSGTNLTIPFALNQPDTRIRVGVDYLPKTGFSASATYRYNSAWQSENGLAWSGDVDAVSLVDVSAGYAFDFGLRLNASVTNLLDAEYRPIANAPIVGRLLLAKATYTFQ